MDGVVNILKPPGMTSHDVVSFLRRQFKIKKIGHAGTLDPQAAGVLPLCIGQGTRLLEYLTDHDKEYLCEMTLGLTTTTQDAWGEVVKCREYRHITLEMVQQNLSRFVGEITQIVPAYSAVKIQGVPLYKRARKGQEITPIMRKVHIYKIELVRFVPPKLAFAIHCSKGTYVRTICHDLGEALGVGGHMSFLLRTRVGEFNLMDSLTLEDVAALQEKSILPLEYCVQGLRKIVLADPEIRKIKLGQKIPYCGQETVGRKDSGEGCEANVAIFDQQGKIQAIASLDSGKNTNEIRPQKVLNRE